MKIGFVSDLHIDKNGVSLEDAIDSVATVSRESKIDKLFIGGDTSRDYKETLTLVKGLREKGVMAYTIFGNNEYKGISHDKAKEINDDTYIHGEIVDVGNDTVVVAIDGHHDFSFATMVENPYTKELPNDLSVIRAIVYNSGHNNILSIDEDVTVFSEMYDTLIELLEGVNNKRVILLTHYIPSHEFVVYTGNRSWDAGNAYMGSTAYQEIAEEYGVDTVIFGHTHSVFNSTLNGVNYHCNPVGHYGREYRDGFIGRLRETIKVIDI